MHECGVRPGTDAGAFTLQLIAVLESLKLYKAVVESAAWRVLGAAQSGRRRRNIWPSPGAVQRLGARRGMEAGATAHHWGSWAVGISQPTWESVAP